MVMWDCRSSLRGTAVRPGCRDGRAGTDDQHIPTPHAGGTFNAVAGSGGSMTVRGPWLIAVVLSRRSTVAARAEPVAPVDRPPGRRGVPDRRPWVGCRQDDGMILVTGASGTIGRRLVPLLAARAIPVRAMSRNPAGVPATAGVEVVRGGFDDPASLAAAVAGADTVFLLTAPAAPSARHDLALRTRPGPQVWVGWCGCPPSAPASDTATGRSAPPRSRRPGREGQRAGLDAATADHVRVQHAVVGRRHPGRRRGPNLLGDGRQGIVDPADVAAVAAEVLASPGPDHTGRVHTLTGPELLSVPDQAAILAEALGRPVELVDTPPAVAGERMRADGMDPAAVEQIVTGSSWARAGNAILPTTSPPCSAAHPPHSPCGCNRISERSVLKPAPPSPPSTQPTVEGNPAHRPDPAIYPACVSPPHAFVSVRHWLRAARPILGSRCAASMGARFGSAVAASSSAPRRQRWGCRAELRTLLLGPPRDHRSRHASLPGLRLSGPRQSLWCREIS